MSMCMFPVSKENTHLPRSIWINWEDHIYLRLFLKKTGNNCL